MSAMTTNGAALALVLTMSFATVAAEPAAAPAASAPPAAAGQAAPAAAPASGTPVASRGAVESLMFNTDELNEIRGRIASGGETSTNTSRQAIEDASLYLSTIVYSSPKAWTIWVNGVPIGPDQEFQSFQVTEINSDYVQLLVPLSAQGMRPVRLSPNQTYITKTGAVIEGQYKK